MLALTCLSVCLSARVVASNPRLESRDVMHSCLARAAVTRCASSSSCHPILSPRKQDANAPNCYLLVSTPFSDCVSRDAPRNLCCYVIAVRALCSRHLYSFGLDLFLPEPTDASNYVSRRLEAHCLSAALHQHSRLIAVCARREALGSYQGLDNLIDHGA